MARKIEKQADQYPHGVVRHDEIKRLRGEDTGLYGEDENDPYDVYAQHSPDGKGWDVTRQVGR